MRWLQGQMEITFLSIKGSFGDYLLIRRFPMPMTMTSYSLDDHWDV